MVTDYSSGQSSPSTASTSAAPTFAPDTAACGRIHDHSRLISGGIFGSRSTLPINASRTGGQRRRRFNRERMAKFNHGAGKSGDGGAAEFRAKVFGAVAKKN
jgi:hypothetical protein